MFDFYQQVRFFLSMTMEMMVIFFCFVFLIRLPQMDQSYTAGNVMTNNKEQFGGERK